MAVINASKLVFGRLASNVAERLLKGEQIDIVNVDKAVIIGKKSMVIARYKKRVDMHGKANPEKGPKYSRTPEKMMKHSIKGMLPKKDRGTQALKKVRAFIGVPDGIQLENAETIDIATYNGKEDAVELGELSKALGWKWSM